MLKITSNIAEVNAKLEAMKSAVGKCESEFPEKAKKILDSHVLPVTPVASGQLKNDTDGVVERNTLVYGPTTYRSKDVLSHLEWSHGGSHAYFFAAIARAKGELKDCAVEVAEGAMK